MLLKLEVMVTLKELVIQEPILEEEEPIKETEDIGELKVIPVIMEEMILGKISGPMVEIMEDKSPGERIGEREIILMVMLILWLGIMLISEIILTDKLDLMVMQKETKELETKLIGMDIMTTTVIPTEEMTDIVITIIVNLGMVIIMVINVIIMDIIHMHGIKKPRRKLSRRRPKQTIGLMMPFS